MTVKTNQTPLRLGIDFGYGYTGVCLLDSNNLALGAAVVEHDTGLSKVLEDRRGIRAMRRRAKSRRRRLRDCYALLAEMDCAPAPFVKDADKGGKAERKKELPANRLYALMHRRGWDYAEVLELLFDKESGKSGDAVGDVDNLLILNGAPANLLKAPTKKPKETLAQFAKQQESYKRAVANHEAGKLPDQEDLRWLNIKEPCLGYLSDLAKQERELVKRLEKNPGDESENELSNIRDELERETEFWQNADLDKMKSKIGKRIDAAFMDAPPTDKKRDDLTDDIMAILGLTDSCERFKDGKEYRPNRNQHRTKMLDKLRELFNEVKQTSAAQKRAAEVAAHDGRKADKVIASWEKRMEKIAERQYRKKRFLNRNPGKCPVKIGDSADEKKNRCPKNLPKRARLDIRKLLFETEARQMNIVVAGQEKSKKPETRKLSDEEIAELLGCVEWDAKGNKIKPAEWAAFFKRNKPLPPKKDESGEEHRGKKDALLDIARGKQAGRTNLCTAHIRQRLELVKQGNLLTERENAERENAADGELPDELREERKDWRKKWDTLDDERIFDQTDAPPSLRQKVDRVCAVAKRLIKKAGCEDRPITHIGIESARFDIHSLSARTDGRILKKNKASYSKSRGSDLPALIRAQADWCFYCNEKLVFGANATVDHVFPKARRGGDAWFNRVAACSACNISKAHLSPGKVNRAAFEALKKKHPKKAAHITERLEQGNKLPPDNLAASVQTMFGSEVLRGALAKEFERQLDAGKEILQRAQEKHGEKSEINQFPKIRSEDAADLRRGWFPFMAQQKKALREAGRRCGSEATVLKKGDRSGQFIAYAGEPFELQLKKTELKKLRGILRIDSAECKNPALKADSRGGALVVSSRKELSDDDVGIFWLRINGECERTFPLAEDEDERKFNLGAGITAKIDKSEGVCAEIVEKKEKGADGKTVTRTKLILRAANADEGKAKKRKAKKREAVVKTDACYLPSIVVCPRRANKKAQQSEDPIYKFHHIMDAAVVAANVDWKKIARLARDPDKRDWRDRARLAKEGLGVAPPDLFAIFPSVQRREDGDFCAPLLGDWLIVDRRDKSAPKAAKTKREPVRYKADKDGKMVVSQRVPLDRITRKEIDDRIAPGGEKIQAALLAEWEKIDALPDDERRTFVTYNGKKEQRNECIAGAWFLQLPEDHFLRPYRPKIADPKKRYAPRSVRVILGSESQSPPFALEHRDRSVLARRQPQEQEKEKRFHYFGREVKWAEAVLYKDGKRHKLTRLRPKWYVNNDNPEKWEGGVEPSDAQIVARFRKGDLVRVAPANRKLPGLWRIKELGRQAAIEPKDPAAYAAARENAGFIDRRKIAVAYRALEKTKM